MMKKGIQVADRSWPEVESALLAGASAILPIGASCKEHGEHLPMATDCIQADWLVTQILAQVHAVAWPTLSYGFYPAFVEYPGSCSLQESTFMNVVTELIQNIIDSGAKKVYVLNTGISTIQPLKKVIEIISKDKNIQLVNVYYGENFLTTEKTLKQQKYGSHADEIETSIMLAIAADKVNMKLAKTNEFIKQPGPLNRTQAGAANFSPSGVFGDACLATQEKGKLLVQAMLEDVLQALR